MCSIAIYASFIFPGKERSRAAPLFVPVFGWIYTARGAWCRGPRRWNGRDGALPGGGCCGFSPYAVGTAGNLGLPGRGPISWEEMGERTPGGGGSSPGTPFSGGVVWGEAVLLLVPGLRPPRPTPHGPPTGSGGREKWFVDGRKKWEPASILSSFSQRVPLHVPSPPSWWAGRYGPFNVKAAGQVRR